jgi:hypothetical protein
MEEQKREDDGLQFSTLTEQFENSRQELVIPAGSGIDPNKAEDLRVKRQQTIENIDRIMSGLPKGSKKSPKLFFSFYTPEKKAEYDKRYGNKRELPADLDDLIG